MPQTDLPRPSSDKISAQNAQQTTSDLFDALFSSIFTLPKSIYNRGNEHGRALTRRYQSECDVQEELQPGQGGCRCYRWEGRHARQQEPRREQGAVKDDSPNQSATKHDRLTKEVDPIPEIEVDDWVEKIIGELEKGEKEAQQLYERWMTVSNDKPLQSTPASQTAHPADKQLDREKPAQAPRCSPWADVFPSWSTEGQNQVHEQGNRQHVFTKETHTHPLYRPSQDVDETIDKDLSRWLGDADQWRQRFQKGFERDSRLWQDGGLFGTSVPFSKPLSTLFSLGIRPSLPEQSVMSYLLCSEHSPLHLELEKGFDSSFRQQFEDLLRAEDGKAVLSKEGCRSVNRTLSVDWLERLIPLLKDGEIGGRGRITIGSASGPSSALQVQEQQAPFYSSRHTWKSDIGPETEQDMYEQHFATFPREPPVVPPTSRSVRQEPQSQSISSITSTFITTERHTAADGLVTTKTVLKTRFANGTEETSETVETTRATKSAWCEQQLEPGFDGEIGKQKPSLHREPMRKGWFWSS